MEVVKKTKEFNILKKKNGRYAIKVSSNKFINGEEKTKILLAENLIKLTAPKKPEEPAAEATPAAEAAPQA